MYILVNYKISCNILFFKEKEKTVCIAALFMFMTEKFNNVCKLSERLHFHANKSLKKTNLTMIDIGDDKLTSKMAHTGSKRWVFFLQKYTLGYRIDALYLLGLILHLK